MTNRFENRASNVTNGLINNTPVAIENTTKKTRKKSDKGTEMINNLNKIFEEKKAKNKSTSLYLSDEVMEGLELVRKKTGKSKSEIANDILETALKVQGIIN